MTVFMLEVIGLVLFKKRCAFEQHIFIIVVPQGSKCASSVGSNDRSFQFEYGPMAAAGTKLGWTWLEGSMAGQARERYE